MSPWNLVLHHVSAAHVPALLIQSCRAAGANLNRYQPQGNLGNK